MVGGRCQGRMKPSRFSPPSQGFDATEFLTTPTTKSVQFRFCFDESAEKLQSSTPRSLAEEGTVAGQSFAVGSRCAAAMSGGEDVYACARFIIKIDKVSRIQMIERQLVVLFLGFVFGTCHGTPRSTYSCREYSQVCPLSATL